MRLPREHSADYDGPVTEGSRSSGISHDNTTTGSTSTGSVRDLAVALTTSLGRVLKGKRDATDAVILTLLAGGHVLLEDVPGVGKTTLATTLSASVNAQVRRLQFTSDMLPTDVTGVTVYDEDTHAFRFHAGPVFTNIAVADEVNRATPRTQSALLEAMAERAVTVDGTTYPLPELFIVIATQNPLDMEGTFPLPEAQRDRFMTRISLGYPDEDSEIAMVMDHRHADSQGADGHLEPVVSVEDVLQARRTVEQVAVAEDVARYLVRIISGTRTNPDISLGASPRAALHLTRMARARAAVNGRSYVIPDDVAASATTVLPHRLALAGRFATVGGSHATAVRLVEDIVSTTRLP